MTEHEPEEPTATQQVISQFGQDIKAAIAEIADKTPELAKTVAGAEVSRRAAWWHVITWVSAVGAAAGVAWLMLTFAPHPHAVDITFRHGDVLEVCARVPGTSPEHPAFVCRPDLR